MLFIACFYLFIRRCMELELSYKINKWQDLKELKNATLNSITI